MKMAHVFRNVVMAGLVAGGLAARAADDVVGEDAPQRLGVMVVESTTLARNLLINPGLESASLDIATTTVDEDLIRLQNAYSLVDAMEFATGVFTEERGRKAKSLSSFRGQIYPYPDYALDGIWQRSFRELPYVFPAAAVERIEILRSGGAIMVGPNSGLVGAINVVPRRFDEMTTLFDAQYGRYNTFQGSAVHGNRLKHGHYLIGISRFSTDGQDDMNAAERYTSVFGAGGLEVADELRLELTAFYLDGQRELRQAEAPASPPLRTRTEEYDPYEVHGGTARVLFRHCDWASTEVSFGYVRRSGDYERPDRPQSNNLDLDWEYNAGILHALELGESNTLRIGAQYNHWEAPNGKRFFSGTEMDVSTFSGVIMDEQRFDRLTLDAGFRYTRSWYNKYADTSFNITGANLSAAPIENEWSDPTMTGTLGARYQLTEMVALYSHAAVGTIDTPTGALTEDGSELERELRMLLDAGLSLEHPAFGYAKLGGFVSYRDDAIMLTETSFTFDGDEYNYYDNADVRQYGVEFEWRSVQFMDILTAHLTATLMDSERRGDDGGWESYREIPDGIVTGGVYAEIGMVDVNLFGKYIAGYENRRFSNQYHELGDYVDLNLTAGVSFGEERATRVYVSFENLLDDDYSTVVGWPDYGFQAFVGVQHRL